MNFVSSLGRIVSLRRNPASLERRLVEAESEIGGGIITNLSTVKHQRFWFYKGYWHYEEQYEDGTSSVVSYQFTDIQAYKLFNGREVALSQTELDNVIETIKEYHTRVKTELYAPKQALGQAL